MAVLIPLWLDTCVRIGYALKLDQLSPRTLWRTAIAMSIVGAVLVGIGWKVHRDVQQKIAMYQSIKDMDPHEIAVWLEQTGQYEPAPQALIDAQVAEGDRRGEQAFVQRQLRQVEERYGRDGIRIGHLVMITLQLQGRASRDLPLPSFDPDENTWSVFNERQPR